MTALSPETLNPKPLKSSFRPSDLAREASMSTFHQCRGTKNGLVIMGGPEDGRATQDHISDGSSAGFMPHAQPTTARARSTHKSGTRCVSMKQRTVPKQQLSSPIACSHPAFQSKPSKAPPPSAVIKPTKLPGLLLRNLH